MHSFTITGTCGSSLLRQFAEGIRDTFQSKGYRYYPEPIDHIRVVFNFIDTGNPRPFRRKAQATFVVSIMESYKNEEPILKSAYPYLVRSLSNHLVYICCSHDHADVYFITPEQGCYKIAYYPGDEDSFFQKFYERLEPLASSQLVINNEFFDDLPEQLWEGDEITEKLRTVGQRLDQMNLLPAPFPIQEYLTPRDLKHLKRLYGIGGLSYGNLSSRKEESRFWMSAAGCNKADLRKVGHHLLLVKGYDSGSKAMEISVPSNLTPNRVSVDAIEHWMIYSQHPDVGAIVHIHAWIDGVKGTEINYPCGTIELAETVAELINREPEPARAIIGLKNHGLTITGPDLDDIFDRIDGRVMAQIPMT
ncbi:class II aldolase/adducin family protein [Paenibacillus alkalitolerans]|uniref:class II aldolase/adducin family protein n=1 Tax=Paenibacillus alkalitolerans TaxID=2799335 RepID=UPI0018F282CA|nr:class II aldolase/adducin family protein [Paenibacillus alkalitolerans]